MVRLRYIKGESLVLDFRRTPVSRRGQKLHFTPYLDVDEYTAGKLIRNPRYAGWFRVETIPPPVFLCDKCGGSFPSHLSLIGHLRSHSEKIVGARIGKDPKEVGPKYRAEARAADPRGAAKAVALEKVKPLKQLKPYQLKGVQAMHKANALRRAQQKALKEKQ